MLAYAIAAVSILGGLAAVLALVAAMLEYNKQGTQKRAELFFSLRERLKSDCRFREILELAEEDDERLKEISFADKRDLLGLFEEVEILRRSKLIREDVARYMFGYYAVRLYQSKNFWWSINKESPYWLLYIDFVRRAQGAENASIQKLVAGENMPAEKLRF
jgi:hypothetical protein